MKKIKLFLISIITALTFSPLALPLAAQVKAQSVDNINCGASGSLDGTDCGDITEGSSTVNRTIKTVIQTFQIIVGLISVFMIIFGGLKYITSGGNDAGVKAAKNTLLYAVIGLVIVVIAQAIVQFVLNRFNS